MSRYATNERWLNIELNDLGDAIQFAQLPSGGIGIRIDEPWAGDTESGFGATTYAYLSKQDMTKFLEWLGPQAIREPRGPTKPPPGRRR